jgi:hypothetical protein
MIVTIVHACVWFLAGFLYAQYKEQYIYWDVLDTFRRLYLARGPMIIWFLSIFNANNCISQ